ncbi:hypothetical protein EVAR_22542_1 [Eumeta japonica]|uniref:Uncharacterized protein n=1 Tax=Eumeta variegata TaxID=151549 RepID=A0A4C1U8P1_EUMVA|nr:hypothetical protein EVAR_22542_1 [Eumeta japonica]
MYVMERFFTTLTTDIEKGKLQPSDRQNQREEPNWRYLSQFADKAARPCALASDDPLSIYYAFRLWTGRYRLFISAANSFNV